MKNPDRLFDLPAYQLAHHPLSNMLSAKKDEKWVNYSTQWFVNTVRTLSANFNKEGIGFSEWTPEKRDKIGIISENRPEWMIVDQATQECGAILVPIYPTIYIDDLLHIIKEAEIKWLFVSNALGYRKIENHFSELPSLERVYSFDEIPDMMHWKTLLKDTKEEYKEKVQDIKSSILPNDLATIIYTSGTSGTPKGVMLSHHNILSNVLAGYQCLPIKKNGRALSFLPLNHVYERMMTYVYVYASVPIYFAESIGTIGENLKEVKPYIFATVPRLLESVYDKILEKGNELSGLKRKLFFWALKVGGKFELHSKRHFFYSIQLSIAGFLVFRKWRQALGGRVISIITGSAACQERLLKLFSAAGIVIMEGYGLTETSPVISVNRLESGNRMFGTIGIPIDKVDVKIAADGEILCKSPGNMLGYYKQPELTAEVMVNGWFKTGDIGEWVSGRFLKITDRKKELFKISGGKYIAPLPIETKMSESPFISQIMVVGSNQKFVAALIVPNFSKIVNRFLDLDESTPTSKLINHLEVFQLIKDDVKLYNQFFSPFEQIKKIRLLSDEWTIEGGELTPTLKLKRRIIREKYKEVISSIYS